METFNFRLFGKSFSTALRGTNSPLNECTGEGWPCVFFFFFLKELKLRRPGQKHVNYLIRRYTRDKDEVGSWWGF